MLIQLFFYMLDQVYYTCVSMQFSENAAGLTICHLSHSSATVTGGLEMILLCKTVNKGKQFWFT